MFSRILYPEKKVYSLRVNYFFQRSLHEAMLSGLKYRETSLEPLPKKKSRKESVLKSLITGKTDRDVFIFPELSSNRYKDFMKWLKPIETYVTTCRNSSKAYSKNDILNNLRELEVFRVHVDSKYYGLELTQAELSRLTEVLSNLPWLGSSFVKNHILPVKLLSKYGSEFVKTLYLPKIMNREVVPTVCINEDDSRTNINNIKSYAMFHNDFWVLNGKKTFVTNGINSNVFLVFARNDTKSYIEKPDSFSLFVVEKDYNGVTCEDVYDTIGRHETPLCTMCFQDTAIPTGNIIGEPGGALNILLECLKPGQLNTCAQAISILRNFTHLLVSDILKLKHFDRNLYEFDIVKKIIGQITFSLYTMESMLYMSNGLMDDFEDMDTEMERTITEYYCANECLTCIQMGLQLIGAQSYMNNQMYIQMLHDAIALITMDTCNLNATTYLGIKTLQTIGEKMSDDIFKGRRLLQFPVDAIVNLIFDKVSIKLSAEEHLHPSLEYAIANLESSINKLREATITILTRFGIEVEQKYLEMERMAEMITSVYGSYANLVRSSRSYSNGIRNAEIEKNIALSTSHLAHNKISAIANDIEIGKYETGDHYSMIMMDTVYEKRGYPMSHPISRTF